MNAMTIKQIGLEKIIFRQEGRKRLEALSLIKSLKWMQSKQTVHSVQSTRHRVHEGIQLHGESSLWCLCFILSANTWALSTEISVSDRELTPSNTHTHFPMKEEAYFASECKPVFWEIIFGEIV